LYREFACGETRTGNLMCGGKIRVVRSDGTGPLADLRMSVASMRLTSEPRIGELTGACIHLKKVIALEVVKVDDDVPPERLHQAFSQCHFAWRKFGLAKCEMT
jgi:hypothetical protein